MTARRFAPVTGNNHKILKTNECFGVSGQAEGADAKKDVMAEFEAAYANPLVELAKEISALLPVS